MTYTIFEHEQDREVVWALAAGEWQHALVRGRHAWDGSTVEARGTYYVERRRTWTENLRARIEKVGFKVRIAGPNARIERPFACEDQADVARIATEAGIADLPLTYHAVDHIGTHDGISVYKCTASTRRYAYQPFLRAEKFVLGGIDPEEARITHLSPDARVQDTLRRAINAAKKLRQQIKNSQCMVELRDKWDRQDREREEAKREEDEREAGVGEDADLIEAAFN